MSNMNQNQNNTNQSNTYGNAYNNSSYNNPYYSKQILSNVKLYHKTLCPFSRFVRILLAECEVNFDEEVVGNLNDNTPMETYPIMEFCLEKKFVNTEASKIYKKNIKPEVFEMSGVNAIVEQVNELYTLYSNDIRQKANTRIFCEIFNGQMYPYAVKPIMDERIVKFYNDRSLPSSKNLFAKSAVLNEYLKIIDEILERRNCIASDSLSIADFCAAAHISCVDYIGSISWSNLPNMKKWYHRIKSRRSFRPLLQDKIPFVNASKHYSMLDF